MAFSKTISICSINSSNHKPISVLPAKDFFKPPRTCSNLFKTSLHPENSCKISCSWTPNSNPSSTHGFSATAATTPATTVLPSGYSSNSHWIVTMEKPRNGFSSKSEIVDFYVETLSRVLPSEKDAQMCIYHASYDTHYGFCCDIDEEISRELAGLPGVLSVRADTEFESEKKDYNVAIGKKQFNSGVDLLNHQSKLSKESPIESSQLAVRSNSTYWLVRMEKPGVEVVTKPQMVDYFAQTLTKVLGNEKDAQMCIYNISWQNNFGFCCVLDEGAATELAGVPGVLSVQPDVNFGSEYKDYTGVTSPSTDSMDSADASQTPNIKTKRLFVTGLSFYTSEKTLRAAFEGFGELVEVKIIMDKISKRSKGYGFIEYTTEAAASTALKEMNGKIINGWMIVVDVAKTNPPRYSMQQRPPRTT